jgi:RNA polymerase sigma factor (sigma-70 family)
MTRVQAEPTDSALLEAWRGGDRQAGSVLFERHYPTLYSFFRNTAWGDRDDLVQRAFLACVEGRDRLREGASFRPYLLTIARRLLFASYRERTTAQQFDPSISSLEDLHPSPSELFVRRDELQQLIAGLRRIPVEQQVTLELFYFHGHRGPDVASILEVPEATVRSRLKRGLDNLRERMNRPRAYEADTDLEAALREIARLADLPQAD